MRGRERFVVGSLLVLSASLSGALVGLVSGIGLAPVRAAVDLGSTSWVVAIVAVGLLLDVANLATGRVPPPASGRQVPQEWTRLFDPRVVAVLFGARLGVGPLTILSTWCWWAVAVAAALSSLSHAVVVGATFGFVRLLVTVGVSLLVEGRDQALWFGRLRSRQRPSWMAMNGLGLLLLGSMAVVGCATAAATTAPTTTPGPLPSTPDATPGTTSNTTVTTTEIPAATAVAESAEAPTADLESRPPLTTPAELEDFVREPNAQDQVEDLTDEIDLNDTEALSTVLISEVGGFQPVTEAGADRHLDLHAAAKIQPDPTEEIALLETRGFIGGWTRAFRNEANDVAVTSVYQFEDPAQAEFYLEDGLITIGGYGGSFFDIEGQPGVRGFAQSFTDEGEELISLGAAFQVGPRWFLTYIVGSPESVTPAMLLPVVEEQRRSELIAGG